MNDNVTVFPPLAALFRAAQVLAAAVCPWKVLVRVHLEFHDGDRVRFSLPAASWSPPGSPCQDAPDWKPKPVQKRILAALRGGKKRLQKQLAAMPGVGNHISDHPGGLRELDELGLLERDGEHVLLTEPGEAWAEQVAGENGRT